MLKVALCAWPEVLPDLGRASIKSKKCFSKSSEPENGRWDQTAAATRGHFSMTFPNTSTNSPKPMELTFSMSMAEILLSSSEWPRLFLAGLYLLITQARLVQCQPSRVKSLWEEPVQNVPAMRKHRVLLVLGDDIRAGDRTHMC